MYEMDRSKHSSNDSGVLDEAHFQANQELLVESIRIAMDPGSAAISQSIHRHTTPSTVLTVPTIGDGTVYQITVADATGFVVGDYIHVNTTSVETTHPKITAISSPTGVSTFTLDRRLDRAHSIGDAISKAILNLATITTGAMATPVEYYAGPPVGEVWYITRLIISMTHGTAGDLGKFGGITALPNGILIRVKINGMYSTLTNWKTNMDMKADVYDVVFDDRASGSGIYSTSAKGDFKAIGVEVRLDGALSDRIELYVQDNLTGIVTLTAKAHGHKGDK